MDQSDFVHTFHLDCPQCQAEIAVRIPRLAYYARCNGTTELALVCPLLGQPPRGSHGETVSEVCSENFLESKANKPEAQHTTATTKRSA